MDNMEKEVEFFRQLIEGVENSNHAAEQAMTKAYKALHNQAMTFGEFLDMRKNTMELERDMHERTSNSWHFWNGRMLSYQDAICAHTGTTLIPQEPSAKILYVEAANA